MISLLLTGTVGFAADQKELPAIVKEDVKEGAVPVAETQITLKVPLFSPLFASFPVATVGDEQVTLDELNKSLAALHERAGEDKTAGRKKYVTVLNRLINSRLIVQEAESMGLEELPEVKQKLDDFPRMALKEELKDLQIKSLQPDATEVEKYYKEAVKEWKIKSVKFEKEDDAKELARTVQAGGNFDELVNTLIDSGKATGTKEGEYVKARDLLPQVANVVAGMRAGSVSPVIQVGPSYAIFKLEDVRYPAGNAEAQDAAREQALAMKQIEALAAYNKSLTKKYAKINQKLLDKLDFEAAKPGFAQLLKDRRVVVEIKGDKPITVADMAESLSQKFFHGIDEAIKGKRINEQKMSALYDIFYARLYLKEAKKLGIDKTGHYKDRIKDFKDSLLFGMFIQKVVAPEIKVSDDETKAYYNKHIGDYSTPELLRIKGLAFTRKEYAEAAIDKLRKGTEYQWLQANAEGQAAKESAGLLEFSPTPVTRNGLPEKMQEATAGGKAGEYRLYESPEGFFYVLLIQDVVPAKPQPLENVQKVIVKKLFNAKLNQAVEEWGVKLRDAYKVQVYITDLGAVNK
ncbi:peptidylprolyl isomerase [Geotalea uraniireducens]|uniref:peptidylprolyl isomerase n=1 Tax=Geotalea uraniireducens TaxID=351604 RepID=UPI001E644853|nr:peptidylprolyl isomerase [Geotalea uraniireducens]